MLGNKQSMLQISNFSLTHCAMTLLEWIVLIQVLRSRQVPFYTNLMNKSIFLHK